VNRVRWLEARWPISIRTLASRLKARAFSSENNDGFLVERVRDSFLEGRFFEKVLFQETVRDPFGNESTFERLTYREVEFTFSASYPQVELRKFSRNTQAFVTRTAELTDFATTFMPVSVDAFSWADKIRAVYPKRFRIDLAQLSEVSIEENVFARIVLSSAQDIRAALGRFTNRRQHRVDRIQIKLEYADELVNFQLAADGTLRSADALPAEVLDVVRQALPVMGARK
jgi:hypothetical protein